MKQVVQRVHSEEGGDALMQGYPLRPELMESTYLLFAATRDPSLLEVPACSVLVPP